MADLPSRLDRATFDRVLQRAAELQAASKDIGDGLSEEEILALGTEVGIPAPHLQQALLEERTRVAMPEANGVLDRWIAPADFVAQRVVQGTPDGVGAMLTKWMDRQEHLIVQRGASGRITFEPMESFARGMRRLGSAFDPKRGKPYLDKAELVTVVITPLEAGFCHVTLGASLRGARRTRVASGASLGGVAAFIATAITVNVAPQYLYALPLIIALGGWAIARSFRSAAHRAQVGLERALDELERHPPLPKAPAGPQLGMGHVIKGIAQEVRKALEE